MSATPVAAAGNRDRCRAKAQHCAEPRKRNGPTFVRLSTGKTGFVPLSKAGTIRRFIGALGGREGRVRGVGILSAERAKGGAAF